MCLRDQKDLSEHEGPGQTSNAATCEPEKQLDQHLLYYGTARVSVRGPMTGKLYEFSRQQPVQTVDPRDAVSMLKTRLFRRIR
jgi:hypothetical protein